MQVHEVKTPVPDDGIGTLNKNTLETFCAQHIFRTVNGILTLVKDKMSDNGDAVQLFQCCLIACEALGTAITERSAGDVGESAKRTLEELKRIVYETECILKTATNRSQAKYLEGKIEDHRLDVEQMLGALSVLNPPPGGNNIPGMATLTVPDQPFDTGITSFVNGAWARLIRPGSDPGELLSFVEAIFSSDDESNVVHSLSGDGAQNLADIIYDACYPTACIIKSR